MNDAFEHIEFEVIKTPVEAKCRKLKEGYYLKDGIPHKKAWRGSRVETLPGGQDLGALSDMEYFMHNLHKGLYHGSRELDLDEDS